MPVNSQNFRHPIRDIIIIALSAPLTNLALAFIFTVLLALLSTHLPTMRDHPPLWQI